MRTLILFALLAITPLAHAQSTDWSTVEHIPLGTPIVVYARHHGIGTLESVSANSIEIGINTILGARTLHFSRAQVREIRSYDPHHHQFLGTAIGAVAGGAFAAIAAHNGRDLGMGVFVFPVLGGGVGGATANILAMRGQRVLYRRP